jgi:hypothetical protein
LRTAALPNGFWTVISNEESMLADHIKAQGGQVQAKDLDERQRVVANHLVAKGLLTRLKQNNKLCYQLESPDQIWRI